MNKVNNRTLKAQPLRRKKKEGIGGYIGLTLVVIIFAYIIAQEVSMPRVVTIPIMLGAIFFILANSFRSPHIPLYILVVYLPYNDILTGRFTEFTGLNMTNILVIITLLSGWWRSVRLKEKFLDSSPLNVLLIIFCLQGLISLITARFTYGYGYNAWNYFVLLKRWVDPIILFFVALIVVKDKEVFKKVVFFIMANTVAIALLAIKDYIDNPDKRVGGIFTQPNYLGAFFAYNMFFFLSFFLYYFHRFKYWFMLIPFLICFRGIMVTFSRGAYVAVALGALMVSFFRGRVIFLLTIGLFVLSIVNPVLLPAGIRYRMGKTFSSGSVLETDVEEIKDLSAQKRIWIWEGALEMIKEKPLTGFGYGTFTNFIGYYSKPGLMGADAHNTYLTVAAELGIPALIVLLLILLVAIVKGWWLLRNTNDPYFKAFSLGLLGGLFALLAANMFGSRLNSGSVSTYIWVLMGLLMRACIMKKNGEID